MELYFHPMSSNARVARMTAVALGIKPELVPVDLQKGEQKKPDYLALNPNGKVPTLVDGSTVLWESVAIAMYLADKTPGRRSIRATRSSPRTSTRGPSGRRRTWPRC